jgi:hypothetical protein
MTSRSIVRSFIEKFSHDLAAHNCGPHFLVANGFWLEVKDVVTENDHVTEFAGHNQTCRKQALLKRTCSPVGECGRPSAAAILYQSTLVLAG